MVQGAERLAGEGGQAPVRHGLLDDRLPPQVAGTAVVVLGVAEVAAEPRLHLPGHARVAEAAPPHLARLAGAPRSGSVRASSSVASGPTSGSDGSSSSAAPNAPIAWSR